MAVLHIYYNCNYLQLRYVNFIKHCVWPKAADYWLSSEFSPKSSNFILLPIIEKLHPMSMLERNIEEKNPIPVLLNNKNCACMGWKAISTENDFTIEIAK